MGSAFSITPDMLHKASVDTANVREAQQAHIAHLRNQLAQLEGTWEGAAAQAFHSLVQRFNTAAEKILTDLQTISESLDQSAKLYGHNEQATKDTFAKTEGGFAF
ncbi:WXG100 family type VII secretion target [Kibdelosporangium philippinense]|uniref:ESAT-6-like protein n=1 Tax=Kibdelosporangium philippinense TaxID=211113 RepID=A0ABS8ZDC3_9PSEU|nr:WXG100 family type VII secretion target [Kibdelosporangium philippinense]MCE7005780.1 WXG100 family type VII secretion target [Kibdelosporangium philippinense]